MQVALEASGACWTRRLARRCAQTSVGPTGTLYSSTSVARVRISMHHRTPYNDTSIVHVRISMHRRTPYTDSSVVRVHISVNRRTPCIRTSDVRVHTVGSSPCLARRRDELIKSITPKHTRHRVPSHRSRSLAHFAFKPRRRVPSSKSTNATHASHTKESLAMHETTLRIFTSLHAEAGALDRLKHPLKSVRARVHLLISPPVRSFVRSVRDGSVRVCVRI